MSADFEICNEPGPATNDKPCCREKGHDEEHYTWHQMPNGHIWIVTFAGENIMHVQYQGKATHEEVAILAAFFTWASERAR